MFLSEVFLVPRLNVRRIDHGERARGSVSCAAGATNGPHGVFCNDIVTMMLHMSLELISDAFTN